MLRLVNMPSGSEWLGSVDAGSIGRMMSSASQKKSESKSLEDFAQVHGDRAGRNRHTVIFAFPSFGKRNEPQFRPIMLNTPEHPRLGSVPQHDCHEDILSTLNRVVPVTLCDKKFIAP